MNFAEIYFGKSLLELTYSDVEIFFLVEHTENETLEFKSYSSRETLDNQLNKGVIRGISAFLNSSGGILIWGAPVGSKPDGRQEEIFIGALSNVDTLKGKDSVINIISSRISPLPIGITLQILEHEKKFIYVFEVQPSISKPHQFNERYYIRLDGQSKPAPHYLIEALFKQIKFPEICGYIKFEKVDYDNNANLLLSISVFICNFSPLQNDEEVSFQLVVFPGIFIGYNQGTHFSKPINVLHYGNPVRNGFTVKVDTTDYLKSSYKVKFNLSFGGKYSPAKFSTYTLDLTKVTGNHKNGNVLIESIEENVLFTEHQKKLGKGKDTFIKDILER